MPEWTIIQTENPQIIIDDVALIGEGWSAWVYRLNEDTVIKLPKREGWDELPKEFKVLEFVQPHLPLDVPKPVALCQHSAGWPFGYAVFSLLHGKELDFAALSEPQKADAVKIMANFLRALHSLKPHSELQSVVPIENPRDEFTQTYERSVADVLPNMPAEDAALIQQAMRAYLDHETNFTYAPTLIHSDLHNEHLLAQDGAITGILDFGDVIMSDPDTDFSDLYLEFGASFAKECARLYGHPNPDELIEKLRHRSLFVFLYDMLYAPEFGMPDDAEWAQGALRMWVAEAKG